jgi:Glycosyltransferase family 87
MTNTRWFRLAMIFLAAVVFMEAAIAWNLRAVIADGQPDFTIFYTAGTMLNQGSARALYDTELQRKVQGEFAPNLGERRWALPFNHPAFEALLFQAFAVLPYRSAYLLWLAVNLMLLLLVLLLLRKHIILMQRAGYFFWLLTALAFFPLFVALLQGQDSILLLLWCVLAYVALQRDSLFLAGCCLALGLFRFHLVLPMVFIFLLHRKWKLVAGFASVAAGLALISAWVVGIRQALLYPSWLWKLEGSMGTSAPLLSAMANLRGMLYTVLHRDAGPLSRIVLAAIAVLLLLWTAKKCNFRGSLSDFDLSFSLVLVTTIVTSYHVLPHDLSLLLLAVLLVANYVSEHSLWTGVPPASAGSVARSSSRHRSDSPRQQSTSGAGKWTRIALTAPLVMLCFGPGQMLMWFRGRHFSLLAPFLLLWMWGIGNAITGRAANRQTMAAPR